MIRFRFKFNRANVNARSKKPHLRTKTFFFSISSLQHFKNAIEFIITVVIYGLWLKIGRVLSLFTFIIESNYFITFSKWQQQLRTNESFMWALVSVPHDSHFAFLSMIIFFFSRFHCSCVFVTAYRIWIRVLHTMLYSMQNISFIYTQVRLIHIQKLNRKPCLTFMRVSGSNIVRCVCSNGYTTTTKLTNKPKHFCSSSKSKWFQIFFPLLSGFFSSIQHDTTIQTSI